MQIKAIDYWLARFNYRFAKWMHQAGNVESHWIEERLAAVTIESPVFITGLARAGSTMLLELLARHPKLASHCYADFPFLSTPWLWQFLRAKLIHDSTQQPQPRPHQDGIDITRLSPESMEEPLWQGWFPWIHQPNEMHGIPSERFDRRFEKFYKQHLAKLLLIRSRPRYLAKNNYHLTRLDYLFKIFPDARLVVPVRDPIEHAESLVRQHRLFCDYSSREPRVAGFLEAVGHFEFGPQRVAIRLDRDSAEQTSSYWSRGEELLGYAVQWASVYGSLLDFKKQNPALSDQVLIIRYEHFCLDPDIELKRILAHCHLDEYPISLGHIKPVQHRATENRNELETQVEKIVGPVARQLGIANGPWEKG